MGRRFLLVVMVAWLAAKAPAGSWGQDPGSTADPSPNAGSAPLPPVADTEPLGIPEALEEVPPPEPPGGDADWPEPDGSAQADPRAERDGPVLPPRDQPSRSGLLDSQIQRAQAGREPATAMEAGAVLTRTGGPVADEPSAEPEADLRGYVLAADRLPIGRQEVVLSVEVQAPASMNLDRESAVRIVVRNSGSADALGVVVRDELPEALAYVGGQPEAQQVGNLLSWRISALPAGSERVIVLKVKPTKTGTLDHAATVTFQAGSRATSRVLRPRLKVEVAQNPSVGKVLKNRQGDFRITVTNTGDGPARNVLVQAKLSPGLRHETGERNEDNSFELPIPELAPGRREELDPLTVDAIQGGEQWCLVKATSPDVVFVKEEAEVTRTLEVVEPKLKMTLKGPRQRYTETVAPYQIELENPGTAAARGIQVVATLGVSGRLIAVPPGAKYDPNSRRLQWAISQIEPGAAPKVLPFEVRMGGISAYEVNVEARGENELYVKDRLITDVQGMPDVDLVVRERRRVVDVDGSTIFQIRLRNYGTKEATKLQVTARLSKNMVVEYTGGGPEEPAMFRESTGEVKFAEIPRLGAGKEIELGIKVKVTSAEPRLATCRVFVTHDDLTEPLEQMAVVKVTETHRTANTGP